MEALGTLMQYRFRLTDMVLRYQVTSSGCQKDARHPFMFTKRRKHRRFDDVMINTKMLWAESQEHKATLSDSCRRTTCSSKTR
jgi:hypothetical protein